MQENNEQILNKRPKPAAGTTRIPAAIERTTIGTDADSLAPAIGAAHGTARAKSVVGLPPNSGRLTMSIIVVQQFFGLIDELISVIIRVEIQLIPNIIFVELILHL